MRSLLGLLAICAVIGFCPHSAMATENWEIEFKERARYLCEWIDHHAVPTGVDRPYVCVAPNEVSPDGAYGEMQKFWSQWSAFDIAASSKAKDSFDAGWGQRRTEIAAFRPAAPAPISNDYEAQIERQQAVAICQDVMRRRPMPPSPQNGGWGDVYNGAMRDANARRAAVDLCVSDPQAHLKPLPWEQSAPVQNGQSPPVVCFTQPGGAVVCP